MYIRNGVKSVYLLLTYTVLCNIDEELTKFDISNRNYFCKKVICPFSKPRHHLIFFFFFWVHRATRE